MVNDCGGDAADDVTAPKQPGEIPGVSPPPPSLYLPCLSTSGKNEKSTNGRAVAEIWKESQRPLDAMKRAESGNKRRAEWRDASLEYERCVQCIGNTMGNCHSCSVLASAPPCPSSAAAPQVPAGRADCVSGAGRKNRKRERKKRGRR